MKSILMACVIVAAACGGGGQQQSTEEPAFVPQGNQGDSTDRSGEMVPPETIEQINNMLARKDKVMSRCLASAIDSGELKKSSRGKVLVELVVSPSGAPKDVKITQSSLESEALFSCIRGHIESIVFPAVPKDFPTSYTYGFEAL